MKVFLWKNNCVAGGFAVIMFAFFITLAPALATAQEMEKFELDEMVVTGTKSERLLMDVPVRTEVITAEDIEAKGAVTLYEALEGIAGVRVESQCSYCNFTQVRMHGLGASHVQVLIDGQPVYSGLASVYGLQQVPTSNIERIEIVKGAASALYGSSTIAGVINIITKKPAKNLEKAIVELNTVFGTENTNTYSMNVLSRLGDKADIAISAQKNAGDEIDENGDNLTDRVWSDNRTGSFRLNYYELTGQDTLTFAGAVLSETRKGGDLTDDNWKNPFAEASEHISTDRNDFSLNYMKKFDYDNKLGVYLTFAKHDRDATNDTFVGDYLATHDDVYPPSNILMPYIAEEKNYTIDVNYAHLLAKHRILTGIQYAKNKLDESGMYVRPSGDAYNSKSNKEADDWGVYLQDEWLIAENLELVIGARYDTHESSDTFAGSASVGLEDIELTYDESSFNPRAALMYKATENFTLRASVGTGFRVPYGFSEDLHLCSGSPRIYKGAGLSPEESVSYTLSADYIAKQYMVSAGIFRTDLKNKIDMADAGDFAGELGYDYEWQNLGDAYTQGIELSSQLFLENDIRIEAGLNYTDAKYDNPREDWINHPVHGTAFSSDSEHLSRVPEFTGGVDLSWTPDTWSFVIDADWTGRMYIDYSEEDDVNNPGSEIVHTDPFWVVNTKIAKSFPEYGITVFIGAKNLFDEIQTDKRPDDAAFMYKPYTGRVLYAGCKVLF